MDPIINTLRLILTAYLAANILNDGRVLAISSKADPQNGESMLMVMRPDGTKTEMFYNGSERTRPGTKDGETEWENCIY